MIKILKMICTDPEIQFHLKSKIMKPEEKKKELNLTELEQVSGGSALDEAPTVDEYDYDEEVREKAGSTVQP